MKTSWIEGLGALGIIGVICCIVGAGVGWVLNIIALLGMLDGPATAMFFARIVGIFFAPLGAILGYC
jgi:hypothetical protein